MANLPVAHIAFATLNSLQPFVISPSLRAYRPQKLDGKLFLGAVVTFRKTTVSFVMPSICPSVCLSVCLSVRVEQLGSH
jgi:hypothetical protein